MASLVADILSSAGKLEREELGSKIAAFSKRIADVKLHVQQNLQTRYVDFLPVAVYTSELDKRVLSCYEELKSLDELIQKELLGHVQESAGEFEDVSNQLVVAKTTLGVVRTVVAFHEALERSTAETKRQDFPEAVNCMLRARRLLQELKGSWEGQIRCLESLECDCTVQTEKLVYDLRELWNEHLRWSEVKKEGESGATVQFIVGSEGFDLQGVACAMNLLAYLDVPLKVLVDAIRTHLLHPIVTESGVTVRSSVEGALHVFTLDVDLTKKNKKSDGRPTPASVFASLSSFFDFAGVVFGSIRLSDDEPESEPGLIRGGGLARRLGDALYEDLCRLLISECLSPAVPTSRLDLGSFDRVIKLTVDFQERLVVLGFVPAEQTTLLIYARNVDVLFADKACREIIARARRVMLKDLYDSVPAPSARFDSERGKVTTHQVDGDSMLTFNFDENASKLDDGDTHKTFDHLFAFPICLLSKSATEFVEMIHAVLEEASCSSPLCCGRLFETAQNMIELYCTVVPCYHRDNMDAFPQQSALFHNNCMYIAHHLLTLGHQYKGKLSLSGCDDLVTFVDQVPRVRDIGTRVFLSQMQLQKKQLLTVLSEVGGFHKLYVSDTFFTPLNRAVKKCMLQLEHLKKVWQGVLPFNVYCKAVGTLTNSLVEEIICQIMQLEDLSADSAGHFIEIFNVIKEAAPILFEDADAEESAKIEIHRRVPKWMKFLELLFLLDANLQSILDRWASGKGPLAQEFSTDEVKKIVRALFQNTDHRASVLAKIK